MSRLCKYISGILVLTESMLSLAVAAIVIIILRFSYVYSKLGQPVAFRSKKRKKVLAVAGSGMKIITSLLWSSFF